MGFLHLLWSLVVGFFVGLIARAVVPGIDQMGLILTTALGIVGSLIGGFIGGLISKPKEGARFHPAGFLLSVVGAVVLLLLWRFLQH
ncbi:MAG TPA: GlsB/YeaQ/YmgE family stress response membrane protein [Thermoanaerobaculaceae bacterium]|nr:GlsB/YeaQ/YmgE family stress response membrane protein [Thermoanaerobaculaceae bacterium]HPS77053.1 GlsB/YeaQ/YmgE family stress response membrane protein [Thermoanaerobaculaceae bacterium]